MPLLHRRFAVRLLAATAVIAVWPGASAPAHAEMKGLEIIAPANPGSGYDQAARAMQQALQESGLASGVQVVNIPGAGGTVGLAQFVSGKKRTPTILVTAFSMVGAIITNKSPVGLDAADPLALLVREYGILTVPADSDIKSMADLVAKLKADPSQVAWGLGSSGGVDHVLAGQIMKAVGADPTKLKGVHYAAGGEQVAATLGGHVTVSVGGVSEFAPQVAAGQLRALGVSITRAAEDGGRANAEGAGRGCDARDVARGDGPSQDAGGRQEGAYRDDRRDGEDAELAGFAGQVRLDRRL